MITITNIFNKMMQVLGAFPIIMGIIAMAGSANDCDGACMETANTLPRNANGGVYWFVYVSYW